MLVRMISYNLKKILFIGAFFLIFNHQGGLSFASENVLKDIKVQITGNDASVLISSANPIYKYKSFLIMDVTPPKAVIDLPGKWAKARKLEYNIENEIIKKIRVGNHPGSFRVVLDLKTGNVSNPVIKRQSAGLVITIGTGKSNKRAKYKSKNKKKKKKAYKSPKNKRADALLAQAKTMIDQNKDLNSVVAVLKKATAISPDNPEIFYLLGLAHSQESYKFYSKKEHDVAYRNFAKAMRLDSKNYKYPWARAGLLSFRNDILGAISDMDLAIKLEPNKFELYTNRALYKHTYARKNIQVRHNERLRNQYLASSLQDYEVAIMLAPDNMKESLRREQQTLASLYHYTSGIDREVNKPFKPFGFW